MPGERENVNVLVEYNLGIALNIGEYHEECK
jgi:hypothetical protein